MTGPKSSEFKSPSYRPAHGLVHAPAAPPKIREIRNSSAADWGRGLPPAYTQVDEFSQSTLGAFVRKCPAATKGVPPPRQQTEKREANLPARSQNGKPHFTAPMSR